ncbi:MAG: 4-hydroxythreonine-4-phosphate dehydrogenase PdxA [Bacteroidales bacterium]|nr:4-hydroxythreonine-4-phosphate dehydrogenase PdxA [Bacteroidales bacterium]MBO7142153.1 4-hydroxythreonine-4-phosphate dehydrogenase PdxA [Bacteroidales bacterium]
MDKTENNKYVIGITQGDINGINYEIIIKALADPELYNNCTIVLYGTAKAIAYHRKTFNLPQINFNAAKDASELAPNKINLINIGDENVRLDLGQSTVQAGEYSAAALKQAVHDLKQGYVDILVTAPINKNNVNEAGLKIPGHTEFLADNFNTSDYLMLMTSDELKIGVVTGHIPIHNVAQAITTQKILQKLRIINRSLKEDFTIRRPKIAVLGLNPHSGDNGVIGNEENEIILPALKQAEEEGITCFGPYPSDGFFAAELYKKFDAVLAMYHDQGLIPFKIIAKNTGINYTAGLPIVRTSPDHGTAYDIAGKGIADETSLKEAIYTGIKIWQNRQLLKGINPLKKMTVTESDKKIC